LVGDVDEMAEKERYKRSCQRCAKLRKRLKDTEEREKMLNDGIDYLIEELRWLKKLETERKRGKGK